MVAPQQRRQRSCLWASRGGARRHPSPFVLVSGSC
ncbi:hypothetical protein Taro_034678 [Colocasia esculenta]|uniref:Uncharacterized protein n=1 Tax=Colocasia esculenta TaxID=4460 RepID=A0A843W4N0_COLES|nr:hypothetical protein [Colocasia esculenta]